MTASNPLNNQTVTLWLKLESFAIGSLSTPPSQRLTVNNIKKIVSYAKVKGRSDYPNLSYSVWKHIACNKLQLSEDMAWIYFVTFNLVNGATPEQRLEFDRKAQVDALVGQLLVPALRFALFLYVQHIQRISLRASLVSGSDEWPSRARSPDLEGRSGSAAGKGLDENEHMTFVLNNLDTILDVLSETDGHGSAGDTRHTRDLSLSLEAVDALQFLIVGSCDGNRTILPLHELAMLPWVQKQSGYVKTQKNFVLRSFQTWIRSRLSANPFGVACCIANGRQLGWYSHGTPDVEHKRGRIATNAPFVPADSICGNKMIVISQVSRQTIARSSLTLEGSIVKIHRCQNSFIYLLSPLRAVSIEKCINCTIVLGPVELSVDVVRCAGTTLIAVGRRITALGSKSCHLYLMTPNRPLIYTGNDSLVFAPYHTHYPQLEVHMRHVGLQPSPNYWDQPFHVGTEHLDNGVWEIMKPADFFHFAIPFKMHGDTQGTPGGLPARYHKALTQRYKSIEAWQQFVRDAGLTTEQRNAFSSVVETRFQEWLKQSGNIHQVNSLLRDASR